MKRSESERELIMSRAAARVESTQGSAAGDDASSDED